MTVKCFNPSCGNTTPLRCSRCKGVNFCGKECQEKIWPSHKHLCKAIAKDPNATCLLLDGMGCLGPGSFYAEGVTDALVGAGVKVTTINLYKGNYLPDQVASVLNELDRYTSCIILGWGSGDAEIETAFANSEKFKKTLISWVRKGGRFIVQGERPKFRGNWPKWFGKEWKQADYCRTDYFCFANSDSDPHWAKWYHQAKGTLTNTNGKYNAKAVLLKNVDVEDVLFGTTEDSSTYSLVPQMRGQDVEEGQCAVAHGKYGDGSVSFFGDVNAEQETCRVMSIIARGH